MKNQDTPTTTATTTRKESTVSFVLGRSGYKFWALAAILLLAFWSMFTGSVTLKWSAGNLNHISDNIGSRTQGDFDILEVEEREKVVRHMWDVYTHSTTIRLPRFWQEAFEAAYEDLVSDVKDVRDSAVSEIAKMSLGSIEVEPPPSLVTGNRESGKSSNKQGHQGKVTTVGTIQ